MKAGYILSALVATLVFSNPVFSQEAIEVKALVKEKVDKVIAILQNRDLDKKTRNHKVIETIDPIFDFELMAKLSLGKKHWTEMDDKKQKEFLAVFVERLKESYLEKLDLYTDEQVEVSEAEEVKSRVHVKTFLVSKDDKKEMIYKFYKNMDGWKVYDVEVLGVSIVQTYRSQFSGFLADGTMAELINKLKNPGGLKEPVIGDKKKT